MPYWQTLRLDQPISPGHGAPQFRAKLRFALDGCASALGAVYWNLLSMKESPG
jgi:hypothetical protein